MARNKLYSGFDEAVADVQDGSVIMIATFAGPGGTALNTIQALRRQGAKNLTVIANNAGGVMAPGAPGWDDHWILFENKRVRKVIASFPFSPSPSRQTVAEKQILAGEVELELVPQGTLSERIRCGAAGIPAFYTPVGYGTVVAEGKDVKWFDGEPCLLEYSLKADYAFVRAHKADKKGNLVFRGVQRQFNPIMAMNAKITIAEVEQVVEAGDIDPEVVVVPGIFVDRIVKITEEPGFPRHLERSFHVRA